MLPTIDRRTIFLIVIVSVSLALAAGSAYAYNPVQTKLTQFDGKTHEVVEILMVPDQPGAGAHLLQQSKSDFATLAEVPDLRRNALIAALAREFDGSPVFHPLSQKEDRFTRGTDYGAGLWSMGGEISGLTALTVKAGIRDDITRTMTEAAAGTPYFRHTGELELVSSIIVLRGGEVTTGEWVQSYGPQPALSTSLFDTIRTHKGIGGLDSELLLLVTDPKPVFKVVTVQCLDKFAHLGAANVTLPPTHGSFQVSVDVDEHTGIPGGMLLWQVQPNTLSLAVFLSKLKDYHEAGQIFAIASADSKRLSGRTVVRHFTQMPQQRM